MTTKVLAALALFAFVVSLRADLVVMQNGERYNGKVLSMNTNTLALQSEMLGKINLSRSKVAVVTFGTNAAANLPQSASSATSPAMTNTPATVSPVIAQLGTQTNLVEQVRGQFLAGVSPEANDRFNQMLSDLTTGKMSIADLRAQAKDAADQLRALEKESGDDSGGSMDIYLSILDHFLGETATAEDPGTPAIATKSNPQPAAKKP